MNGPTNLDHVISSFTAATTGTYYAVVSGAAAATYDLVVTRNAGFDTEPNTTLATAEDITGAAGAVGSIASSSTIPNAVVPAIYTSTETNNGNAFPFSM